ncbi:MAG TPA: hypothetical protein VG759_12395 [Candidatus Angelobacter sp.]|nr:hypothetical protein [Candidatus Angelobacter sp.]
MKLINADLLQATLKMAVLAPMPSARVMIAIAVKPGAFRNIRQAVTKIVE